MGCRCGQSSLSAVVGDTACFDMSGSGTGGDPFVVNPIFSPDNGNILECRANGLYAGCCFDYLVQDYAATALAQVTPATAEGVYIYTMGSGGAGGSGRRGAAASVRGGGAGGSGGTGSGWMYFTRAQLGATFDVTVGATATGGTAIAVDSTNGNPGGNGAASGFISPAGATPSTGVGTFGMGGLGGGGGTTVGGTGGAGQLADPFRGGAGGTAGGVAAAGSAGEGTVGYKSGGGGGGAGITAGNAAGNGGAGGVATSRRTNQTAPAGGVSGGASPETGESPQAGHPSSGGGGGASTAAAAAQNGAAGTGYGAGGGGGGAAVNGQLSGASANGGPGHVRLVWVVATV